MSDPPEISIQRWQDEFARAAASADGADLPAHSAHCLGCGPNNPYGHHLQVRRHGDRVLARHTFDARHIGGPGVAHGGAVAAVLDDLCGFVLYIASQLAVTRNLSVDYYAPARLDVAYDLTGWLTNRDGRRLFIRTEGHDPAGHLAFSSDAVFLAVEPDHFTHATTTAGPSAPLGEPGLGAAENNLPHARPPSPVHRHADQEPK